VKHIELDPLPENLPPEDAVPPASAENIKVYRGSRGVLIMEAWFNGFPVTTRVPEGTEPTQEAAMKHCHRGYILGMRAKMGRH
jgi:hypothetical protein